MVFEDASAANYGRGGPPFHELSHLREVDYVSAACVVFRRALFAQLGGFDLRVRSRMLKVNVCCYSSVLPACCNCLHCLFLARQLRPDAMLTPAACCVSAVRDGLL